jgi:CubicO group peptidase (beta-lactamase class C family)
MLQPTAPAELGFTTIGLTRIDEFLQSYLAAHRAPGVVTLVARHGKPAYIGCYGLASLERAEPIKPETLFRIYSMTKPITCAALLMLVEAGRIDLDDPVARYLPAFASMQVLAARSPTGSSYEPPARPLRIHDLLTHTAGLGYGLFDDSPIEDDYRAAGLLSRVLTLGLPLPELVDRLAQLPLAGQPGREWRYSFAHDVLAQIIAMVSGMPFDHFLRERIFTPLGMYDTGFVVPKSQSGRLAGLYLRRPDGTFKLFDDGPSSFYVHPGAEPAGGGGLVSTVGDYLRFAQMLLNRGRLEDVQLLQPATIDLMTRNQLPADMLPFRIGPNWIWDGYGFGLGVAVVLDPNQAGLPGTVGAFEWPGAANTMFWVDPQEGLIGLLMTQVLPSPPDPPIGLQFRRLVYAAMGEH